MKIIDREASRNCPTSKFLSRDEFISLFPGQMPRKVDFIFKHNVPVDVEDKVGEMLIDKYPNAIDLLKVEEIEEVESEVVEDKEVDPPLKVENVNPNVKKDDKLDGMAYNDLKKLSVQQYNIPQKETWVKKPKLIAMIRKEKER